MFVRAGIRERKLRQEQNDKINILINTQTQFMYRLERLYALMEEIDRREIRRGRSEIKRLKILFERKREELAGRLKLESAGATTSTTSRQPDTAACDKPDSELRE